MEYNTFAASIVPGDSPFFFDVGSLYHYLGNLKDHRKAKGKRYPLALALVFVVLAKLAGEDEPRGIAHWIALRSSFFVRLSILIEIPLLTLLLLSYTWQGF